ncbi:hypothetical protein SAMN04489751_1199 [Brevibacterium sandarakinum]|uniref:Membrane protein YmcC n=1 Tax=Brevibacterium sandarakinum TaxID=629680 RepID=A0A1H1PC21_BRESA|nr:hypothetical protein [Brevibacterium sandarakinum]SDS08816.1 hypothetical protein SAMN04489751_1199 [Brevibacterium sandarakinum]
MLSYIIVGEVLFWVLLMGGLAVRYLLGGRVVSSLMLVATPVVDIVIIVLTYLDLAGHSPADFSHGLAAFYVGFSVVFGPDIIRGLDRRFTRRYSKQSGVRTTSAPQRSSLADWYRCLFASGITLALLLVGIVVAGLSDSFWLIYWLIVVVFTAVTWAALGPVRESLRKRRRRRSTHSETSPTQGECRRDHGPSNKPRGHG